MSLSDKRGRHDRFFKRARKQGYRARAVFKLEQIDQTVGHKLAQKYGAQLGIKHGQPFRLIAPGARVLDLGCAPGSWLQYCAEQVGPTGALVGIDRGRLNPPIPGARLLVGDVHEVDIADLLGDLDGFDVVLSDMAPDTSGIRHVDQTRSEALFERALDIARNTLVPGGHFVAKIFQGPEFQNLRKLCRSLFVAVKIIKPEGSRTRSIEQYIVACGFVGRSVSDPSGT